MTDISNRRPLMTPRMELVLTIDDNPSGAELEELASIINAEGAPESGIVGRADVDASVDSIGIKLITAAMLDDVNEAGRWAVNIINREGYDVVGGVQIQAITERSTPLDV